MPEPAVGGLASEASARLLAGVVLEHRSEDLGCLRRRAFAAGAAAGIPADGGASGGAGDEGAGGANSMLSKHLKVLSQERYRP